MSEGHHSKRRVYPQQQYDFSQAPPPAQDLNAYSAAAGGQVFTPGAAAAVGNANGYMAAGDANANQLAGQFQQMNVNGAPEQPLYGQAPAAPAAAPVAPGAGLSGQYNGGPQSQQQQFGGRLPLNQLYNIDLLQSLPPPVTDLALPPPPVVLMPDVAAMNNPATAQSGSEFVRSTLNVVPTNGSLLKKSKLPFALVVRPFTALLEENDQLPLVTDSIICRCRRCRSYINPFITFMEQQHRWKCNICGLTNEVPTQFDWDQIKNVRKDRYTRAELNYGANEFIAPTEYLVRAPQPPVYVFVLDCSISAIQNGLLATAARTILESLDRIPNKDGRTRVGFITVDSALHFFKLPAATSSSEEGADDGIAEPSMLVVSDLDDPFLPSPSDLLVNLTERRAAIETFLGSLGEMFAGNVNTSNALGSALKAAHKLIGSIGGKIISLTASLPNVGVAKLEQREDRKLLGTSREGTLLQTANSFYKSFAVECNRSQVTLDMFLFSASYQDVASLSNLPRYTGGQTYFYPGWTANRPEDAVKFAHEFGEHLSMDITMEAVLRVRASTGLRLNSFYGNFFSRSSDLCSFPTFPRDQSYVIELGIEDTITKPYVYLQVAVLHTTNGAERRIRTLNLALPTSSLLQDVYASADQLAITNYLTRRAVEKAISSGNGIQDAHDYLTARLTEMLTTYKKDLMTTNVGASAPLQFSANMRMLPLLVNGLLKHVGLRKAAAIPSDLRSAALCLLSTLPLPYLIKYIHPDFYSLHDMPDGAGYPDEETGEIVLPPKLNLTGQNIVSHGLYLIDDGQTQFLWVGRDAVPALVADAFGVDSLAQVKAGKTELAEIDTELNKRIRAIIGKSREHKDSITYPSLYIVKEDGDPSLRLWATTFLIEDRTDQTVSYVQFLNSLRDKISN